MNTIIKFLEAEHSKQQTKHIADYIGKDKVRLKEFMDAFVGNEYVISQRAAWVLPSLAEDRADLLRPYLRQLVDNLKKSPIHDAVIRNTLNLFEKITIDESIEDKLTELCFIFLQENYPVAIKAHAMTILEKMVNKYPELKSELIFLLEEQMPYSSAGFKSRGSKILLRLKK